MSEGTDRGTRLWVATRKGLFLVERGASGWRLDEPRFLGDNVSYVLPDRARGRLLAAMDLGHFGAKLRASRDGGATWHELGTPAYPEQPPDMIDNDYFGNPIPWKLEKIWTLAAGAGDVLWCGTIPGGLFRSGDGGESWSLVRGLWDHPLRRKWMGGGYDHPGIHVVCVDPRDPRTVRLGVSTGGVWQSDDDGATWRLPGLGLFNEYMPPESRLEPVAQDVHCLTQCAAEPDTLWVQHHNGVFRSTDGAASWTQVTVPPSHFGFPVVVHPSRGDTAWFVPAIKDEQRLPVGAQMVVSRTRDGGASFEVLRGGLPQAHCYDLVYRHGLDIDDSGDRLAMGSTTGSLWVSENQGDHWQCVSTNLPPIYCVRFEK